ADTVAARIGRDRSVVIFERNASRANAQRDYISIKPHESSAEASRQTPDLLSPKTTTITSRPGTAPLAMRQWPAVSVYPVFIPLQKGNRFSTWFVFSSSRIRPLA